MKKEALLTVIIPVFNGEQFIRDTTGHILSSTYPELEVLLIDDGSTDDSGRICRSLQEQDGRIKYIYTENGGIAAARNKGLEAASGQYVCFCDQDDETRPDMYEDILTAMEKHSADIGMCSTGRDIDGKRNIFESLRDGCYEGEEIRSCLLYPLLFRGYNYDFAKSENYLYGSVWKCIFKRQLINDVGITFRSFVDYKDDWLFVTQALTEAKRAVTVSKVGYYWKVNRMSRSHTHRHILDMPERLQLLDAWEDEYLGRGKTSRTVLKEYQKVRLCEHYVSLMENGFPEGRRVEKKAYYEKAKKYILQSGYRKQLEAAGHLKKNALKRRLVLGSLRYLGIRAAFCLTPAFDKLIQGAENISWLVRWERKSKTGKRRRKDEADYSDSLL